VWKDLCGAREGVGVLKGGWFVEAWSVELVMVKVPPFGMFLS